MRFLLVNRVATELRKPKSRTKGELVVSAVAIFVNIEKCETRYSRSLL